MFLDKLKERMQNIENEITPLKIFNGELKRQISFILGNVSNIYNNIKDIYEKLNDHNDELEMIKKDQKKLRDLIDNISVALAIDNGELKKGSEKDEQQ